MRKREREKKKIYKRIKRFKPAQEQGGKK